MPEIGKPTGFKQNSFRDIKMAKPARANAQEQLNQIVKKDVGRELNAITGSTQNNDGIKYVDGKKHNVLGKDGFLKLLATQMQNQDPFKPMDQKQFAADLAQFSQLEQLANINTKMDKSNERLPSEMKFYGAGLIGKLVTTKGTSLNYKEEGKPAVIPFYLPKDSSRMIVKVFDNRNQLMAQIYKENVGRGQGSVTWNGQNLDTSPATKGEYRIEVKAWDKDMDVISVETKTEGKVTGVDFDGSETLLVIDGKKKVFLNDVDSFRLDNKKLNGQNKNMLNQNAKSASGKYKNVEASSL
jgi:flagellar basal-body rod modification protein FlgD